MDNKILFDEIEKRALVSARIYKKILNEYKPVYDALFYTCDGMSLLQRNALYRKIYKLLKKDIKKLRKIEKAARKAERAEKSQKGK